MHLLFFLKSSIRVLYIYGKEKRKEQKERVEKAENVFPFHKQLLCFDKKLYRLGDEKRKGVYSS